MTRKKRVSRRYRSSERAALKLVAAYLGWCIKPLWHYNIHNILYMREYISVVRLCGGGGGPRARTKTRVRWCVSSFFLFPRGKFLMLVKSALCCW